jgi:hypothetical protein
MMVPTYPAPHLVMIHPDFAFGFFKDRFDRPSHSADANELMQRSVEGSIAEKVFDLSRVIQITADDGSKYKTTFNQSSPAGRPARDSVTRRNAKSQTMGPLLPSLITA